MVLKRVHQKKGKSRHISFVGHTEAIVVESWQVKLVTKSTGNKHAIQQQVDSSVFKTFFNMFAKGYLVVGYNAVKLVLYIESLTQNVQNFNVNTFELEHACFPVKTDVHVVRYVA
jgi:hypothetical protein